LTDRKYPDDFIPAVPRDDDGNITPSELIAMAWDDDTSFDHIKAQSGYSEAEIIKIMRTHMQPSSFRMWRKRVSGRKGKHEIKRR